MSPGYRLLSPPPSDKIRLQCPEGPWGASYIIKYTGEGGGFVIQSLGCLDIHSASSTDDKAMDESDKRAGGR